MAEQSSRQDDGEQIMLRKRQALALTALCSVLVLGESTATANDLTLYGWKQGAPANVRQAPRERQDAARARKGPRAVAPKLDRKKGKAAHGEDTRLHRIHTYSLIRDPFARLSLAADERRVAPPVAVVRPVAPVPAAAPRPARAEPLRSEAEDNAGLAFGCRERPFSKQNQLEVAACFRHNVDRSWKAQTYVSRGIVEGTQTWGGGMSIVYDY